MMSCKTRNNKLSKEISSSGFSANGRRQLCEINSSVKGLVSQVKNLRNELEIATKELEDVKTEILRIKQILTHN